MISPSELKQQMQQQIEQSQSLDWLHIPARAKTALAQQDLPNRKLESWKYTSVAAIQNTDYFTTLAKPELDLTAAQKLIKTLPDVSRLVFINGRINLELSDYSDLENQGIITLFSNANDSQKALINKHLGSICDPEQHFFAALNYAQSNEGVLIHVPAEFKVGQPILMVYLSSDTDSPGMAHTRSLVIVEPRSQLELIEQYDSIGNHLQSLHNHVEEIVVMENAQLRHLRIQAEDESHAMINGLHIELAANSHYEQHALTLGSLLKRNDINIVFQGQHAYAQLNGVFLSKHRQHIDNHINLEHASAHCNSDTEYKGFVSDNSRAIFNGRIHIHPQAQKTAAHLNNKNLLLSKQAELNTKPELEIYADDVQCSHGASIGQLDEQSLFYFQSRGNDRATAEAMLCMGFVNEMVRRFPNENVQRLIADRLARYFNDVDQLHALWSMESNDE